MTYEEFCTNIKVGTVVFYKDTFESCFMLVTRVVSRMDDTVCVFGLLFEDGGLRRIYGEELWYVRSNDRRWLKNIVII